MDAGKPFESKHFRLPDWLTASDHRRAVLEVGLASADSMPQAGEYLCT